MSTTLLLLIISTQTSFSSLPTRSDYIQELVTSNEDNRGDWTNKIYCNQDEYAIGYQLKVQGSQFVLDDTAANSLRLSCSDGETLTSNIEGSAGGWSSVTCAINSYITSYRTKNEPPQSSGDDTSLNSVSAICNDQSQTVIETSNAGPWGDWSQYVSCSINAAVCGFRQNIQRNGLGDSSAMQAVRFQCCSVPTMNPTKSPSDPIKIPTNTPSINPSIAPSLSTITPSNMPTMAPTNPPSVMPSMTPSDQTIAPTHMPTVKPTLDPSVAPTYYPSVNPTYLTLEPTSNPTEPEKRHDIVTSRILQSTFVGNDKLNKKQSNVITIVLAVVGIVVFLMVCAFCGCFYIAWKKSKIEAEKERTRAEFTVVSSRSSSRQEQKQSELENVEFADIAKNNHELNNKSSFMFDGVETQDTMEENDDILQYCNTVGNDNVKQGIVDTESDDTPEKITRMDVGNTTNGYNENIAGDAFIIQGDDEVKMNHNTSQEGGTGQNAVDDEIIENGVTVE